MAMGVDPVEDCESQAGRSHRPAPEGLINEFLRDTLRLPAARGHPPLDSPLVGTG